MFGRHVMNHIFRKIIDWGSAQRQALSCIDHCKNIRTRSYPIFQLHMFQQSQTARGLYDQRKYNSSSNY
jgi:hypothetical protein